MATEFNVDEIFEIALQIERNGAAFYRKAAECVSDAEQRDNLLRLAAMEVDHENTFTRMKHVLGERRSELAGYDPNGEAAAYLHAFAHGRVFDLSADPLAFLAEPRTVPDILKRAIELEQDSVLYYVGMKEAVPRELGRTQVESIIQQEIGHIALLFKELHALR